MSIENQELFIDSNTHFDSSTDCGTWEGVGRMDYQGDHYHCL